MNRSEELIPKIFRSIDKLVDYVSGFATLLIILVVLIQISGRAIGNPAPWTEEATRFIFIWMIFIGIATGFRSFESARVTILIDKASPRFDKIADFLYIFFSISFFFFMVVYGFQVMMQQVNMNEMGSALRIPMWLVGLSVPVSGVLGMFAVFESFYYKQKKDGYKINKENKVNI